MTSRALASALIAFTVLMTRPVPLSAQQTPLGSPGLAGPSDPSGEAAPSPDAPEAQTEPSLSPGPNEAAQNRPSVEKVELRLEATKREREEYSLLLPRLALGLGIAGALAGAIGGAVHVIGCDGTCDTVPWVAFAAVAGVSLATLGAIWTIRAEADVRELDSQRYQLEQELERVRLSRLSRDLMRTRSGSVLSFRFAL